MHLPQSARVICVAISAFALAGVARAGDIVDTGPGPGTVPGWALGNGVDTLAGKFTLTSTQQVSAVYGWIGDDYLPDPGSTNPGDNDTPGVVDVSILSGDINADNVVYSGSVDFAADQAPGWFGPNGLSLALGPGDYWVEFSGAVPYDSTGGFLGYMSYSVPDGLEDYAYNESGNTTGFISYPLEFGVQVVGVGQNKNSVPDVSSTALLVGFSMFMLLKAKRRRRLARI
jgi:hypothetical protein